MVDLTYTGERVIPDLQKGDPVLAEHLLRYAFARAFVRGKTVLDIACGSGYGCQMLADAGATAVCGVDRDALTVEYARERYGGSPIIKFLTADALALPFESHHFDVVTSFETIEHLPDADRFLSEVKRVLKPAGILLLSTPTRSSPSPRNPYHTREFTPAELLELLRIHFAQTVSLGQFTRLLSVISEPIADGASLPLEGKGCLLLFDPLPRHDYQYSVTISADDPAAFPHPSLTGAVFRSEVFRTWADLLELRNRAESAERRLAELEEIVRQYARQAEAMRSSSSWRLTRPLRSIKCALRAAKERRR